eukprot:m.363803 g.363803  ORF g.363803 m.363803 type:complete len:69 (-) comp16654_c0_seq35:884-1090(-)
MIFEDKFCTRKIGVLVRSVFSVIHPKFCCVNVSLELNHVIGMKLVKVRCFHRFDKGSSHRESDPCFVN